MSIWDKSMLVLIVPSYFACIESGVCSSVSISGLGSSESSSTWACERIWVSWMPVLGNLFIGGNDNKWVKKRIDNYKICKKH